MSDREVPVLDKSDIARLMADIAEEKGHRESIEECRGFLGLALEAISRSIMGADPEVKIKFRGHFIIEVKMRGATPWARNPRRPEERVYIPARRKASFVPATRVRRELLTPLVELGYEPPPGRGDGP